MRNRPLNDFLTGGALYDGGEIWYNMSEYEFCWKG